MKTNLKLRTLFLIPLFLLSSYASKGQEGFNLSGIISDKEGKNIEVGNILLLALKDSTLIKGDLFMEGAFEIKNVKVSSFLLKITALGYEEYFQKINNVENKDLTLEPIKLQLRLMETVEVIATQNIIERRGTDLIVNVANTALSNAGTVMDVIQNSPKVVISRSGEISIIGKGAAVIYLDGQQIPSTQLLQNISSNDIKQIEIIENPSAKYDASGNAVINIITKGKSLEGYKIGLIQEAGKARYFRSFFQVDTYFKINKLMLQATYGIKPWTWGGLNLQTIENLNINYNRVLNNYFRQSYDRLDHNLTFRLNYDLSLKSKFGFQYTGVKVDADKIANNIRTAYNDQNVDFRIKSSIAGLLEQESQTFNTFLNHNLDTLGSNIRLSGQYSNFDIGRMELNNQRLFLSSEIIPSDLESNNRNKIAIYTVQADLQKNYKNNTSFEGGIKNAFITNKSTLGLAVVQSDGQTVDIPELSNDYIYDENILAGYGQISWTSKSLKFTTGLRAEWTQTNGLASNQINGENFNRNYFNLFPSLNLQKTVNEKLNLSFNYNYRIDRPTFQALNPFVFFVDSLVSIKGNPNLLPQYSHNFASAVNIKKLSINFDYVYTKNTISQIFRSLDPNNLDAITFVIENLNFTELYSLSISRPVKAKWYSAYFSLGGFYDNQQTSNFDQSLFKNRNAGFYFQANQSFQLPFKMKLDTYFKYTSSRVDGVYLGVPISYLNVGLSRKFLNNALTVRFWANDIFNKFRFSGYTQFNNMEATFLSDGDFRFYKFSLNWNFGKLGTNALREKKISRDELNRVNAGF